MADIVVIGAGMGGLASAIDLSAAGHRVTVLEAHGEAGGKVGRTLVEGVEFDTGPSVLTLPDVLADLFDHAGTSLQQELTLLSHEQTYGYRWPDGATLATYHDVERTLQSVAETFGPVAADQLSSFLAYARGIWEAAAPAFVLGDAPTFATALGLGLRSLGAMRRIDPMRRMSAAIERHVAEPHLRDVLSRYATYNGSDPRRAPATLNCIAHVELALGGYGIEGGMYELARALERVAVRHGAQFRYNSPVTRIIVRQGRVQGVETDSGEHRADFVIANADVAHVFGKLLPDASPEDHEPSMSAWTGVVRARRRQRAPHEVVFPETYRREFEDIFDHHRAPRDPTVYVCAQEPAHRRSGWTDHEPLFVMANAPPHLADDPSDVSDLRDAALRKLIVAGVLDPDDTVVWQRAPADLAAQFPASSGAIYGAASNTLLAAFQRPSNRVDSPRGLYLASGSAHPGGGVPLCLLSGRAAARAVLEDQDI